MYLLLLSMSAHLTKELGMAPGGEFRRYHIQNRCLFLDILSWNLYRAFIEAMKVPGCKVHLGDRPINITLKVSFCRMKHSFCQLMIMKFIPEGPCCTWASTEVASWMEYPYQQRLNHKVGLTYLEQRFQFWSLWWDIFQKLCSIREYPFSFMYSSAVGHCPNSGWKSPPPHSTGTLGPIW